MRLTKYGHSCVRIEHDGVVVVIDPGVFTAPGATEGADVVLITHEHPDHWSADHLRATTAPIHTIGAVAAAITEQAPELAERITVVAPGEQIDVGLPVSVVGEQHAVIHRDLPRVHNSGYLITAGNTRLYHPGDALTPPGADIDLLLAPVCAPWMKIEEAVDFVREVAAPRTLAIHDKVYSDLVLPIADTLITNLGVASFGGCYTRLADGADLE